LAHVYSFPDNRQLTLELIKKENIARQNRKGLWSHPRWNIHTDVTAIKDSDIGQFNIFEGFIHNIKTVRKKTYINFGANWREDFTVEIPERFYTLFEQSNIDIKTFYTGKKLQVRGVFKPVNGVLVTATHPEQLTILD
jgi:micrococcal nuclease